MGSINKVVTFLVHNPLVYNESGTGSGVFRSFVAMRCGLLNTSSIILFLMMFWSFSFSQTINVRVNGLNANDVLIVSPVSGSYVAVSNNDTVYRFRNDDVIRVSLQGDSLVVKGLIGNLKTVVSELQVVGTGVYPEIKIRVSDGGEETYANDLAVMQTNKKWALISRVDIDNYVSRVLIEEVGYNVPEEYLKIQAIISRTYAYKNLNRHAREGFDLCDNVHCQVYDGKREIPTVIHRATAATSGIIVSDTYGQPILATFHANCGGQTANSEDVWNRALPYLTSVVDTFCLTERSAVWEKRISLEEFRSYLTSQADFRSTFFKWTDLKIGSGRKGKTVQIFGEQINLPIMRRDLKLRSTNFELHVEGDTVKLNGHGFGHGVGLCQQGAIKMARLGFGYRTILGFYFKGTALNKVDPKIISDQ